MINFDATATDRNAAFRIARRAAKTINACSSGGADALSISMDLIATHLNGCPLDFVKLEGFDDFNLLHDICGIERHLDRDDASATAGQLRDCFVPRCAAH